MTPVSELTTEAIHSGKGIDGFPIEDALAYHWAPTSRRESIQARGLRVRQPSSHAPIRYPMVCLALDPVDAWAMSGGTFVTGEPTWDLWVAWTGDLGGFEVIPNDRGGIRELRVYHSIRASAVRYVGTREATTAEERP